MDEDLHLLTLMVLFLRLTGARASCVVVFSDVARSVTLLSSDPGALSSKTVLVRCPTATILWRGLNNIRAPEVPGPTEMNGVSFLECCRENINIALVERAHLWRATV